MVRLMRVFSPTSTIRVARVGSHGHLYYLAQVGVVVREFGRLHGPALAEY
jgi:hypothetical protein